MADIKLKETKKGTIKTLNKSVVGTQKVKNNIISTKEKVLENTEKEDNNNGNIYAVNKVSKSIKDTPNNIKKINKINNYGRQKAIETQKNIKLAKDMSINNNIKKRANKNIIKTVENTNKTIVKTPRIIEQSPKTITNNGTKVGKQTIKRAKELAIKTINETRKIIKNTTISIKTIATGTKALIIAMLAGGWAIGVILIVICIIAMLILGIANGQAGGLIDYNDERTLKYAIYGTNGSNDIVQVALSQVGNVGGEPYWSWYGFSSRVEWCATFVSWCANECGYIESGVIPKFASCENEGVKWFKEHNLWQERGYIAKPGDIAFFDWKEKHDGLSDHVGIVEKVENGRVYTIEGNSNDSCRQRNYDINSEEIQGYGTPIY